MDDNKKRKATPLELKFEIIKYLVNKYNTLYSKSIRVICLCILIKKKVIGYFWCKLKLTVWRSVSLPCLISDLVIMRPRCNEVILLVPTISLYPECTVLSNLSWIYFVNEIWNNFKFCHFVKSKGPKTYLLSFEGFLGCIETWIILVSLQTKGFCKLFILLFPIKLLCNRRKKKMVHIFFHWYQKTRGPWWPCIAPLADTWNPFISNITLLGNWFNPFPNKPWFLRVCSRSLLKTLREKEKSLVTSNFSFSHSVFHPFWDLSAVFIKFENVVCKLFQFGRI